MSSERRIPFESDAQAQVRATDDSSETANPTVAGYIPPGGGSAPELGTEVGPYVEIVGRASADGTTGLVSVDNGESQRVATDQFGILWTRNLPGPAAAASAYVSKNYETQATVLTQAGVVIGLRMLRTPNLASADRWLMVFDTAAVVANNAIPIWRALLPAVNANAASECWDDPAVPFAVTTGLTVAMSTTDLVLTLPAANEALFGVLFK